MPDLLTGYGAGMGSAIGEPETPLMPKVPVPTRRDVERIGPVLVKLDRLRLQCLDDGAVMLCPDDFCRDAVEIYGLRVVRMPSLDEPMIGLPADGSTIVASVAADLAAENGPVSDEELNALRDEWHGIGEPGEGVADERP